MPRTVTEYRCLLVSPSDVEEERRSLVSTIDGWNAQIGEMLGARINLVRWETHSIPDISGTPQDILNRQIVDKCDMALALFWSRAGTPTDSHPSGSVEEIERLLTRGARIMVYFKNSAIPQQQLDIDQWKMLQEIKRQFRERGLLGTFDSTEDLNQQLILHVTPIVSEFLARDRASDQRPSPAGSTVLAKPVIRVRVQPGLASNSRGGFTDLVGIHVENHSTMRVFLGNITIRLKDSRSLFPQRDSMTGRPQERRTLEPGERFTLNVAIDELLASGVDPSQFDRVCVVDDIGRTYVSEEGDLVRTVQSLLKSKGN
jgi:hypothetical protein